MSQHRQAFKKAFPYTIPVLTGYLFIGIAFGVMYAEKGLFFRMGDINESACICRFWTIPGSEFFRAGYFFFTSHFFDIYGECQTCVLWNLSFGKI